MLMPPRGTLMRSDRSPSAGLGKPVTPAARWRSSACELDACLSSPKVRAMQTATLACEPLGIEVESCAALSGAPFSATDLAAGRGEVLLVGHDPSFSLVLHDMTGAQAADAQGRDRRGR